MAAGAPSARDIMKKYSQKLQSQLNTEARSVEEGGVRSGGNSGEYEQFLQDMQSEPSTYEKWAKTIGNIIHIGIAEKDRVKVQKYLDDAHVDVTPSEAMTLALMSMLTIFFGMIAAVVAYYFISFPDLNTFMASPAFNDVIIFFFLGMIASLFVFYYTSTLPQRLANAWRLKASSQMVPAILYVVVYMKHTSNLERAIQFASQHLEGPLALDFKKIFYDVEIGKFSMVKQSLEYYLKSWRDYAPEFVESFHLIESSLFEPSEARRVEILERALQVILDGVYEKMLKYSREIRSPLTNLYMLGIILPTLGLALLPLASTLMQGLIRWPHVFILFNVIIPFFVFYMVIQVLLKRPGGYGESSMMEFNPDYGTYKSKKPWLIAALVAIPLILIGLLPFIFQIDFITNTLNLENDYTFQDLSIPLFGENDYIFDFKVSDSGRTAGPFGLIGVFLSLFIPLGVAMFFYIAYSQKTKTLIKSRKDTKQLESEFANSLFQLGNRLGDGTPVELAFGKVAVSTQGQKSAQFFNYVSQNVQRGGMGVEGAVFDPRRGAIIYFPSALIATSIRILIESAKKGLKIAAQSLMSISQYVKNIEKINQRLRDLLAEIVSDMKSNMTFLAPLLAGIVVGLASMITVILNKLDGIGVDPGIGGGSLGVGSFGSLLEIFNLSSMVPPYFIQLSVGLYIIEVVFILTGALVTVDSGKDKLREKNELAKNLRIGIFLYLATAFVSTLILSVLAGFALGGFVG